MEIFEERTRTTGWLEVERVEGGFQLSGVGAEAVDWFGRRRVRELAEQLSQLPGGFEESGLIERHGLAPLG